MKTVRFMFIVIFIFWIMTNISPIDNSFNELINGFDTRLKALENARQPYQADWIEINPATVYTDGGDFVFDRNANDFLSVGDRICVNDIYYFWVLGFPTATTASVVSDSGGQAVLLSITSFKYSKLLYPSGHPEYFIQPLGSDGGGVGLISTDTGPSVSSGIYGSLACNMIGNLMFCWLTMDTLTVTGAGTANYIYYDPGAFIEVTSRLEMCPITIAINGTSTRADLRWDYSSQVMVIDPIGTGFTAGNDYDIQARYFYTIS